MYPARALIVVALLVLVGSEANAAECSEKKKARILEPATKDSRSVSLDCDLTLRQSETVTKQLRIAGARASGLRLVCKGGIIGSTDRNAVNRGRDMIHVRSIRRDDGTWSRPENVVIDGCEVNGSIRIFGLGQNGQSDAVRVSSRREGHTRRAQSAAPRGIELRNLVIRGGGRIPVYFSPGVTHSKLTNSRIVGRSNSSGIYLDAESAHNTITGNTFSVRASREILSVDGSARNTISGNVFNFSDQGGIFVYRNCGEGGAARHQQPRQNRITNNTFRYSGGTSTRPTVWLSFKTALRTIFLCSQDSGIAYGSGTDNRNFARENTVAHNTFVNSPRSDVVRDDDGNNTVFSNRLVQN